MVAAAFALGAAGSVHCAAMCGPLAAAGCRRDERARWWLGLGYLGGRLAGYAAVGALVGAAGAHLAHALPLVWLQRCAVLAVAVGAAARGVSLWAPPRPLRLGRRRPAWRWVVGALPRRGLGLGLVTGVLPCGLLAAAWMLAATAGGPVGGAAAMAAFAAGSLPGLVVPMLAVALAGGALPRPTRRQAALIWCALAVWLALRPVVDAVGHAM